MKDKNKRFLTKDCLQQEEKEEEDFDDYTEVLELMKIGEPVDRKEYLLKEDEQKKLERELLSC